MEQTKLVKRGSENDEAQLDTKQTLEFLRAVDGTDDKNAEFQFALIQQKPDHPKKGMTLDRYGTFEEHRDWLEAKNLDGFSVFICVNDTDGSGSREKSNMTRVRGVWNDADHGVPDKDKYPLLPTLRVHTSPGKVHDHWLLELGMTFDQHRSVEERLEADFGCDPAVKNVNRIMRVPGYLNWRPDTPFLVRTKLLSGLYYTPREVIEAFPQVAKKSKNRAKSTALTVANATRALGRSDGFGESFDEARVQSALAALPIEDFKSRHEWMKVVQSVHYGSGGSDEGYQLVCAWSEGDPDEFDEDALSKLWNSLSPEGAGGTVVTLGTLFTLAKEYGHQHNGKAEREEDADADYEAAVPKAGARVANLVSFSDISMKPVDWLWKGRIAKGAVNLIVGPPGQGKSQTTCDIAARVTTGRPLHGEGKDAAKRTPQRVIMLNAEDNLEAVVKPRLVAAKAKLDLVATIQSVLKFDKDGNPIEAEFSLREDIITLDRVLGDYGDVGLVTIDPVSAYLGKTDSHNNSEVRGVLAPIAKLAEKHNVAFLIVSHLNKSSDQNALNRITGSGAFGAAARSVLSVGPNLDESGAAIDGERVLISLKSNLARPPEALVYRIEGDMLEEAGMLVETSHVEWIGARNDLNPDDVMNANTSGKKKRSQTDLAADWLREKFGVGMSARAVKNAADVIEEGEANGHSERTLQRAKTGLGIEAKKNGKGGWNWIYAPH